MKQFLLILLSVFALNATCVYAQNVNLTEKEQKAKAKEKKEADKKNKKEEKERAAAAKKAAKREAQYQKFKEMVENYEPINLETKNIAELDTLVKNLNLMMVDVVVLEKEYDTVGMVSEPFVDEDGVADTIWYARNKTTQERYSKEDAETLLKSQRSTVLSQNVRAGALVVQGVSAGAAVAAADLNTLEKLATAMEATSLLKQAKLIKYGLTSMNFHLKKNMELLGFQIDNEANEIDDSELDNFK